MVNHCCVPLCHSKSSREKELSFHRFPKCESKKKKWKVKIRPDEGELFTIIEHTRVCSLHFTGDDYGTTLGGLKVLKDDAVPSVFPWKTPVNQRLSKTSSRGMANDEEKTPCSHCQEKDREIERLTELLQEKDEEIKVLKSNFMSVKSRIDTITVSFKQFEGSDGDIHFYPGFQNASSYREFMTFVLCHAENMSYWSRNRHGNLLDGDEDSTQTANVSTGHTNIALSKEDELFLTLARLRLGLPLQHIANLFNISIATVSRVFTTSWINLLYFVLGSINFWLPKHTIQETMPDSFRKFPSRRVILDASEFMIQTPSSLLRQSQIYFIIQICFNGGRTFIFYVNNWCSF